MDVSKLFEEIRRAINEDERWALACNLPYRYADEGSVAPAMGVHWTWVTGDNWDPVIPDPVVMEYVEGPDGSCLANLATVEEWPSTTRLLGDDVHQTMMPRTYSGGIEEMDPAAAGHIVRHDPDRILRQVAARRRTFDRHQPVDHHGRPCCAYCRQDHTMLGEYDNVAQPVAWPCPEVVDLADAYGIAVES